MPRILHPKVGKILHETRLQGLKKAPPIHLWTNDGWQLEYQSIREYQQCGLEDKTGPAVIMLTVSDIEDKHRHYLWWARDPDNEDSKEKVRRWIKDLKIVDAKQIESIMIG